MVKEERRWWLLYVKKEKQFKKSRKIDILMKYSVKQIIWYEMF